MGDNGVPSGEGENAEVQTIGAVRRRLEVVGRGVSWEGCLNCDSWDS